MRLTLTADVNVDEIKKILAAIDNSGISVSDSEQKKPTAIAAFAIRLTWNGKKALG